MHKSEIRELRKKVKEAKRKAVGYEDQAENTSAFIRDHMLKSANEQHRLAAELQRRIRLKA